MPAIWIKRAVIISVAGLIVFGLVLFAWPRPVQVDIAMATKGAMAVTIDDEAKTRVRHVYTISAPVAGRVLRISPPRHVGDEAVADETVVAVMQPAVPSFLDVRSRQELQAVLAAAEAAVKLVESEVQRNEAAVEFARSELRRAESLARTDAISAKALDKAKLDVQTNEAALASAKALLEVRRHQRHNAAARLVDPASVPPEDNAACCVRLRAPISGRILRIIQESEAVVQAGAPLLELGDPRDLEIVADLLSTEAVKIEPGAAARIDGWGGAPVRGRVTRVDPAGFLKISALGIEEQRVRTTIDLIDPPETWSRLGHDYRVIVHVTVWNGEDVVSVPVGAIFRRGDDWAVFAVRDGRARTTAVQLGHRNNRVVQVLSGLSVGDRVILHPSDRITEGRSVAERDSN